MGGKIEEKSFSFLFGVIWIFFDFFSLQFTFLGQLEKIELHNMEYSMNIIHAVKNLLVRGILEILIFIAEKFMYGTLARPIFDSTLNGKRVLRSRFTKTRAIEFKLFFRAYLTVCWPLYKESLENLLLKGTNTPLNVINNSKFPTFSSTIKSFSLHNVCFKTSRKKIPN